MALSHPVTHLCHNGSPPPNTFISLCAELCCTRLAALQYWTNLQCGINISRLIKGCVSTRKETFPTKCYRMCKLKNILGGCRGALWATAHLKRQSSPIHYSPLTGFRLSICETPRRLWLMVRSEWVKYHFRLNYPFKGGSHLSHSSTAT